MATIPVVLGPFVNEDGTPNIQARLELHSLIPQLPPIEIRLLKERLDAFTAHTWIVDFIPKLPVELLLSITNYFTLKDLSIILTVSKSWYKCFTRSDVIDHLARKHFNIAWETSIKIATPSTRLELFNTLLHRTNSIHQGNYSSMRSFSYGSSCTPKSIRRSNGDQVAWTSNEMIFVRNLISGDTKRFVTPERHRITGLVLRGDYLLAMCLSSALYAWSIETEKMYMIRLTSFPHVFDTNHGNMYVSLSDSSVLKWEIGKGTRQLSIPNIPKESTITFLGCDPISKDTFIRCFMQLVNTPTTGTPSSTSSKTTLQLVAEKFHDNCMISSSTIDISLNKAGRHQFTTRPLRILTSNAPEFNENGDYNVTFQSTFTTDEKCTDHKSLTPYCHCGDLILRFCYNTVECQWQKYRYVLPSLYGAEIGRVIHFTKTQALVSVIPDEFLSRSIDNSLVIGIDACGDEISQDLETKGVRCICGPQGNIIGHRKLVIEENRRTPKLRKPPSFYNAGLRYVRTKDVIPEVVTLQRKTPTTFRDMATCFQVYGNSTFTICFGPTGFIVWCHDKDITLAQQSDQDRQVLKEWLYSHLMTSGNEPT